MCVQALGRHQATLNFQVVSSKVPGCVLSETSLQVQGSSLTLGNKQPLPGGITATPDTFKKPRQVLACGCSAVYKQLLLHFHTPVPQQACHVAKA
jgi:hypothetical protein